ncbi:bifunctional hydroxymethylpyrimidine kinase/phosphomethylpyrimidine kinase [Aromatoleum evansii]|uniref:Bifunctional hydroxymethylpyrimidine kinase/phosphomethylpyrimidine kinase n=1 Tax=Aromatoleum evansii TaxID=59406 RepID=A0ABZ1AIQ6_AROEV|nr:bifunctional hydroxymethylpyrimidine kinase/phosphomethylpyrimidine kinase [Aromatoleum evansii]NMG29190.1 hydroxymethylpyrimidine/phosphomethylpyrimidine kinase [Aromatoleum evansii]WRL45750.1 bifunctional hydroxymethylpyrimidine kinase/phosphomethylpyrimidine kinase [Aromatoleum evansii]
MPLGFTAVPPVVLCFATSDATAGAGLQSDVLTLASMGCHPLSVVAAIAVRDTRGVEELLALDADAVDSQARALLEDIPVQAFKLGLLGSVENVAAIAEILSDYPDVPLVLEPALSIVDGEEAAGEDMLAALAELVLPQVTVLVASRSEVLQLAALTPEGDDGDDEDGEFVDADEFDALGEIFEGGEADDTDDTDDDDSEEDEALSLADAIARVLGRGVQYVLLTGAGEPGPQLVNVLVGREGVVRTDAWERLPGPFLGAGATLAAALVGALAQGMAVAEAVREAQEFTVQALTSAYRPGMGMAIPDRFFWARANEDEDGKA